ncbi:hypothetical protein P8C59_006032 [Phyllachora maydis]|uniref:Uncharacterized protein n=1 Tax=Phyllachora maydis TaxID=1825666 RepID=A0AAD9MC41_9PEZI|nr:hypothetical protein P8C59_006032 [Phyllachora maydis]
MASSIAITTRRPAFAGTKSEVAATTEPKTAAAAAAQPIPAPGLAPAFPHRLNGLIPTSDDKIGAALVRAMLNFHADTDVNFARSIAAELFMTAYDKLNARGLRALAAHIEAREDVLIAERDGDMALVRRQLAALRASNLPGFVARLRGLVADDLRTQVAAQAPIPRDDKAALLAAADDLERALFSRMRMVQRAVVAIWEGKIEPALSEKPAWDGRVAINALAQVESRVRFELALHRAGATTMKQRMQVICGVWHSDEYRASLGLEVEEEVRERYMMTWQEQAS